MLCNNGPLYITEQLNIMSCLTAFMIDVREKSLGYIVYSLFAS